MFLKEIILRLLRGAAPNVRTVLVSRRSLIDAKRRAEDARADSQLALGYFRRLRTREGEKCEANHGAGEGLREAFSTNGSSAMVKPPRGPGILYLSTNMH